MPFRDAFDPSRALECAWAGMRRAPWILLLGGLLLSVFEPSDYSGFSVSDDEFRRWWLAIVIPMIFAFGCVGLVFWLLYSWIYAGFASTCTRLYRTGAVDVGELFSDRSRWISIFFVRLLQIFVGILSLLPLGMIAGMSVALRAETRLDDDITISAGIIAGLIYLPVAIYVMLGFGLAKLCVAVDGLGPVDAMSRSWQLVRGNRWIFLVYSVLMCFVAILGLLCCCVPVIFTTAWTQAAYVDSYLALTRSEERAGWWIALPEEERKQVAMAPRETG